MKVAILAFPGSSCDVDMEHAFKQVLNQPVDILWHTQANLQAYDAVVIPNGAAYGDYLRPGALTKGSPAMKELLAFAETGKPILGVGNGFHVLTEAGLLPGAFLRSKGLKFEEGVAAVRVVAKTRFTSEYEEQALIELPYATQYGNYYVDEETAKQLKATNQIVMTYETLDNGSVDAIAAVTNETGTILGMLPLPERAVETITGGTDGLGLFESLVKGLNK